jgi:hypothetical protein
MVGFFETKSFWQGGFTEEQQNYYEEHHLSQKGKHLCEQINRLYIIARNVCSTYNVTYCFDRSCCCRRYKHLPFQCEFNDDVTISSYINGNYEFYDVEQIEEFIAWKGAFELAYLLENYDDALYKYEVYDILKFCFDNYKEENGYILKYLNRCSPMEETNVLKEPMEEEIPETGSSLDEKEEESDDQEEEEWSYPCLPPDKSNSLTNTLFDHPQFLKEGECDIYIVEFVHDATEKYYERGKDGCWSFNVTKTPLFILKVPKLLLFYLPMLVSMCIGSGLDLNVFHIYSLMLSFASIHISYVTIFSNY